MKRFLSALLAIAIFLIPLAVCADSADSFRIEQVYSNMPEIKAFVKAGNKDTDDISGYIGSKKLHLSESEPYDRNDGISFVFMFDCSTSVSSYQMSSMKKTVTDFINANANPNDRFVIVAFGETVDILFDGNGSPSEATDAVATLRNNQNATVLFDAVNTLNFISKNMDDKFPKKSMAVVFTDAVDYNIGGTTKEEMLDACSKTSIPLYVVAINPNNKTSVDMLGQVARTSGGSIFVAKNGNIPAAFDEVLNSLKDLHVVTFRSDSNVISDDARTLRIVFGGSSSAALERKFVSGTWQKDNKKPVISAVEVVSSKSILVHFSEQVANAGKASNYTVKKGAGDRKISSVLYDEKTHTATINFEDSIGQGKYKISLANITDRSMEKNPLDSDYAFSVTGFKAFMLSLGNFFKHTWWVFVLLIFVVIALIMIAIIRKRKGIIMVDNKATFADNVKYEPKPAEPLPSMHIQLIMEYANGGVTNLDINIVRSMIFGRSEGCEVKIDDNSLSRQHFVLEVENGQLLIQNLSQTNGTFLNGVLLNSKRVVSLGDEITAGQEKFTVTKM